MSNTLTEVETLQKQIADSVCRALKAKRASEGCSWKKLAGELGIDASAISRLMNNEKRHIGLKSLLQIAVGLQINPAFFLSNRADEENGKDGNDKIHILRSELEEDDQKSFDDFINVLAGLKNVEKKGNKVIAKNLLTEFAKLARESREEIEKEKDSEGELGKIVGFREEWRTFGRLVEATVWSHKGFFWKNEVTVLTFSRLTDIANEKPLQLKRIAKFFELRQDSALVDDTNPNNLNELKEKVEEYLYETGGHYTGYRLMSKILRHEKNWKEARKSAKLALHKLDMTGEDNDDSEVKTYVDKWERIKCLRDLVAAYMKELRWSCSPDRFKKENKKKLIKFCDEAEKELERAQTALKDFERDSKYALPLEKQRLASEEAEISFIRGVLAKDKEELKKYFDNAENFWLQSKRIAAKHGDDYGQMRMCARLYELYLKQGFCDAAISSLAEILQLSAHSTVTPRLAERIKSSNARCLDSEQKKEEKTILEALSERISKLGEKTKEKLIDNNGDEGALPG